MKHISTIIAALSAVLYILPMQAKQITQQQARQQAAAFMQQHGMTVATGATSMAKSAVTGTTSATGTTADAAYYAFNDESGKGFVIISGDDRTDAVLGYSDSGTYNEDSLPENMKAWLQGYVRQIRYIDSLGITSEATAKAKSSTLTVALHDSIAPLIKTKWDQGAPYNNLCPLMVGGRCQTGCAATALAQVMYYHQWPQDVTAGIPAYDEHLLNKLHRDSLPPVQFEWSKMSLEKTDVDNSIATLMEYCGYAVKMSYGVNVSLATSSYIPSALSECFGYDKGIRCVYRNVYTISGWDNLIYNELAGGRPVIYGGQAYNCGGHGFVCDGYDGNGLYHINWGWSGLYDGYFKLSVLQPFSSEDYTGVNHDGYNYGQIAVIGIQKPNGGEAEQKIHLNLYQVESSNDSITVDLMNDGAKNTFEYGWAVLKSDGSLDVIKKETITLLTGYYKTDSISPSEIHLTAGVYHIVPVSRVSGTETWYNAVEGTPYSIKAVVNYAGKVTLTLYPNPILTVVSDSMVGSSKGEEDQYLHLAVNSQGGDYNGNLYLFASKTDTLGKYVNMVGTAIEEDSTEDVVISFVPADTGVYHLWVATDKAGQNIIYQDSVEILHSALESNLATVSYVVNPTDRTVTCTVANNSTDVYHGTVMMAICTPDSSSPYGVDILNYYSTYSIIASGGTKDLQYTFADMDLQEGVTYYAVLTCKKYYSSEKPDQIITMKPFVISATGIDEPRTDSDTVAPYYTLQGFRLDARPTQKGLYIRKGKTVVVR